MKITKFVGLVAVAVVMTGCAGDMTGHKGKIGAAGGAAGGALLGQAIGNNTEATLIGAAVGTMLGYIVGNEMDKFDRAQLSNTFETGASNVPVTWQNPDTQSQYTMTPQPAYQATSGQFCRDAQITAFIDGRQETVHTTACRDQSGNWQTT